MRRVSKGWQRVFTKRTAEWRRVIVAHTARKKPSGRSTRLQRNGRQLDRGSGDCASARVLTRVWWDGRLARAGTGTTRPRRPKCGGSTRGRLWGCC